MTPAFTSPLVIATHNPGKLREIADLLAPLGVSCLSAGNLGLAEPEENGASFEANARIKALAAATVSGHMALADDSGLCVEGLEGAPGIYSARWAGEEKNFSLAMRRVEQALTERDIPPEGAPAFFVCSLALASPEGQTQLFTGTVHGTLTFPPRGDKGFGYDPIFIANGYPVTFAEMEPEAKHAISHRADAFAKLCTYLGQRSGAVA